MGLGERVTTLSDPQYGLASVKIFHLRCLDVSLSSTMSISGTGKIDSYKLYMYT